MVVKDIRVEPYSLTLKRPWMTANGIRVSSRKGWLITIHSDTGLIGIGDCAPFQSMGSESEQDAQHAIGELLSQFLGEAPEQLLINISKIRGLPATKFALESAIMDLDAKAQSTPLYQMLGGEQGQIKISANAGSLQSNSSKIVEELVQQGYTIIKFKVGFQSIEREVSFLRQVCDDLPPDIQLRLDANRAWSNSDAEMFISNIADLPIESVEEPLQTPDLQVLTRLQQSVPFDIALDESLIPFLRLYPFKAIPAKRIIIKPTIIGGIQPSLVFMRHAAAAGIRTTVTSTLESACGLFTAAHLAVLSDQLNEPSSHGLATSSWFEEDIGQPPPITQGTLDLARCKGTGFTRAS